MNERYYREEYAYLLDAGREFAERYPELARMLRLDDARAVDPNVERLLEGVAFLTARITRRLEEYFPELVEGLVELLWPVATRVMPPACMVQLRPSGALPPEGVVVPPGARVGPSSPPQGLECSFRTSSEVWLSPVSLKDVGLSEAGEGMRVVLQLASPTGADPATLAARGLRLHFAGEGMVPYQLYQLLLGLGPWRGLKAVEVTARGAWGEQSVVLGPEVISPVGLEKGSLMLPARGQLWLLGMAAEYFVLPERFLGMDLRLPQLGQGLVEELKVGLVFGEQWPAGLRPGVENFRLGCTPAVNLMEMDAEPIRLDHTRTYYRLVPELTRVDGYQVYSVEEVVGVGVGSGRRITYRPLMSAGNPLGQGPQQLQGHYYVLRRMPAPWGGIDYYLAFTSPSGEEMPEEQVVSVHIQATNGAAAAGLGAGEIDTALEGVPDGVEVANLAQPSPPVFPPLEGVGLWRWLGLMSMNIMGVASAEGLKRVLRLVEGRGEGANLKHIDSILELELAPARRRMEGAVARGVRVRMVLDEQAFASPGQMLVFARVVGAVMMAHAAINTFVEIEVVGSPSGRSFVLGPRLGAGNELA